MTSRLHLITKRTFESLGSFREPIVVTQSESFASGAMHEPTHIVIDLDTLDPATAQDTLRGVSAEYHRNRVALIASPSNWAEAAKWLNADCSGAILRPPPYLFEDLRRFLRVPELGSQPPATTVEWQVEDSSAIRLILLEIEARLVASQRPNRIVQIITTSAQELLTNALYHSPRDADGTSVHASTPRTERVTWPPSRAEMRLEIGETWIKLRVTDPYGSLEPKALLETLGSCMREEGPTVREDTPGAGIGVFSILRNATSLTFDVERNVATHATLAFEEVTSFRRLRMHPKRFLCHIR